MNLALQASGRSAGENQEAKEVSTGYWASYVSSKGVTAVSKTLYLGGYRTQRSS